MPRSRSDTTRVAHRSEMVEDLAIEELAGVPCGSPRVVRSETGLWNRRAAQVHLEFRGTG
jgi:hypothetical protein